ncbi:unnamed protein product [Spirodela intermedia]|uniref:Uncharacterized protein n=1 Tax=Spirodela intermedia TaxID=51605 RepID=A0A7I8JT96_SPIIN|nr:unnamed protein product [Spirodela intermedia]CAA6673417.1 unnamed protein product [Spirodela intermedia]
MIPFLFWATLVSPS